MKSKREIATGILILAIATVFGQEPPAQEPAKPDQKQDEQPAKPAPIPTINVEVGAATWGVSGNENKFRQYATPPKGFFLRDLTWTPTFLDRHDAAISIKAPFQDDYRADGMVRLFNGMTYLFGSDSRNRFFDPNPSVLPENERHIQQAGIRQKITPNLALSFSSRMDQQDVNRPAPLDAFHQRTRIWTAAASGSPWKDGFADVSYTDWRYWDRTNVLPDTNMQSWSAGLLHQFGDFLSLHGSYTNSRIHQPALGSDTNRVESWSAGGDLLLGDDTQLIGEFRSEKLTLPVVENAYDRDRQLARGRIVHNFGAGWTGQFGYSRLALERMNASHTFVDVPKWHTFDFRVAGKLSPSVRMTVRGSRATMQGSAGMETDDPRALYWRNRWSGEVKLDASNDVASGYLVFGIHDDRNDVRDVRVRNQSLTFGGSYQAKPELELYMESSYQLWSGTTTDPLNPNLNQYFPDGTTFTLGANWTISNRMFATANYTLFNTSNDNPLGLPGGNVRGNFFTGTFHYTTAVGVELGLTFAPWQYADRLYSGWGYDTGLVQLTAKARF